MDHVVVLHNALAEMTPQGVAPEWVQLVPSGAFSGNDGRGPYRLTDPAAVMRASMEAGDLVLDENHSTDLAAPRGEPAPARGWIVELQARETGIWGRVDWTDAGRALMADKAYRGISPALRVSKGDGRVLAVLRASLVNNPNLRQLATLHQKQESVVDLTKLRAALGLADDADDAAILAAAAAARTAVTTHATQLQRIAAAARIADPAKAGPDEIVTALQAAGAGDVAALRATVVELQSQLATVTQERARDRAVAVIDQAIKDGKPIAPIRDHYVTRHMADPAGVEKELGAMPSLHAGGLGGRSVTGGAGGDGFTAEERQVVTLMGLDPEAFKKSLKARNEEAA